MTHLNENEVKVLNAICMDCDDIDGEGFNRLTDMMVTLIEDTNMNGNQLGGYITSLANKNCVIIDAVENEVWVPEEVFARFC